ncbi:hypothetical protein SSCG_05614 [Streptomyces clavuligerus]|nr:hypothetical protein SSCG_05614 [Streptomyces clavuligerus]
MSRRASSRAPSYGVAASRSAARISTGGSSPRRVRTSSGCCRGAGQKAHGRFIQTLSQVSNGALRASAVLSRSHTANSRGQGASLHSIAVYTAAAFSAPRASSARGAAWATSGSSSPRRYAASARARGSQKSSW